MGTLMQRKAEIQVACKYNLTEIVKLSVPCVLIFPLSDFFFKQTLFLIFFFSHDNVTAYTRKVKPLMNSESEGNNPHGCVRVGYCTLFHTVILLLIFESIKYRPCLMFLLFNLDIYSP